MGKRGPKPDKPAFDRSMAELIRERYIKGDTYAQIGADLNLTAQKVNRTMKKYGIITQADNDAHWVAVMDRRVDAGIRVGRKSNYVKQQEAKKQTQ